MNKRLLLVYKPGRIRKEHQDGENIYKRGKKINRKCEEKEEVVLLPWRDHSATKVFNGRGRKAANTYATAPWVNIIVTRSINHHRLF